MSSYQSICHEEKEWPTFLMRCWAPCSAAGIPQLALQTSITTSNAKPFILRRWDRMPWLKALLWPGSSLWTRLPKTPALCITSKGSVQTVSVIVPGRLSGMLSTSLPWGPVDTRGAQRCQPSCLGVTIRRCFTSATSPWNPGQILLQVFTAVGPSGTSVLPGYERWSWRSRSCSAFLAVSEKALKRIQQRWIVPGCTSEQVEGVWSSFTVALDLQRPNSRVDQ